MQEMHVDKLARVPRLVYNSKQILFSLCCLHSVKYFTICKEFSRTSFNFLTVSNSALPEGCQTFCPLCLESPFSPLSSFFAVIYSVTPSQTLRLVYGPCVTLWRHSMLFLPGTLLQIEWPSPQCNYLSSAPLRTRTVSFLVNILSLLFVKWPRTGRRLLRFFRGRRKLLKP